MPLPCSTTGAAVACWPPPPPDAIAWADSAAIDFFDFAADAIVGVDGPLGVNGLVDFATHGSGGLALPAGLLPPLNLTLRGLGPPSHPLCQVRIWG